MRVQICKEMVIKNVLISQPAPPASGSPYTDIIQRFGVNIDFRPFFKVQGLSAKEFRTQKINILDYTAIVFCSKTAIDSFFRICEETRVTVPETMKYFCQSEAIAVYLQKYIVYRKRKIFFGTGTFPSIIDIILGKHKAEKILIAVTDGLKDSTRALFADAKLDFNHAVFVKTVINDLSDLDIAKYQMVVFYSPSDIRSLRENFPEFKQDELLIATYGPKTAQAVKDEGLKIEIEAPTPAMPSIAVALKNYLGK